MRGSIYVTGTRGVTYLSINSSDIQTCRGESCDRYLLYRFSAVFFALFLSVLCRKGVVWGGVVWVL